MRVHDGAYGTLLAAQLEAGETVDDLGVRAPASVTAAHRAYLDAGATVLQTNTFLVHLRGSMRRRQQLVEAALACAREAAEHAPGVVELLGTIGPCGSEPRAWWYELERMLEAGVSGVLCETITDAAAAGACIAAWQDVAAGVVDVPLLLGLSVVPSQGRTAWSWVEACAATAPDGVEVGLNCCAGPAGLRPVLESLCEQRGSAWVVPSAGVPEAEQGDRASWPLDDPAVWVAAVEAAIEGVPVTRIGGCCGTRPEHVDALASALA